MNIMLNSYCNLRCPYCFANTEINSSHIKNISEENFDEALEFLINNNIREVRLIGGEPTLHPYFIYFIQKIINKSFFEKVSENGISFVYDIDYSMVNNNIIKLCSDNILESLKEMLTATMDEEFDTESQIKYKTIIDFI